MVTTLFDAERLLAPPDAAAKSALAYLYDDTWQGGAGWVGPRLASLGQVDATALAFTDEVRRTIVAANLVRDIVGRHAAGVVGREVAWEVPVADADSEALTAWWDRRVLPTPADAPIATMSGVLGLAVERAICGEVPVLRFRVTGEGRSATLAAALERVHIEVVSQAQAAIYDLDTGPLGVVAYDAAARTLAAKLGTAMPQPVAELVELDEQGRTLIRVVGWSSDAQQVSDPLPLGGRITMHAVRCPRIVTESLLTLQRRVVATLSGMGNNTNTAGYAERTYLNADRPGAYEPDPTAPEGRRFVPSPLTLGPGHRLWLRGIETDAGYTSPTVNDRAPSPPGAFTETDNHLVFTAYREARQLHALIGGDATASGESRRQAAADFIASLGPTAQAVELATRWLIETAYALALALQGRSIADDVRATATVQLSGVLPTMEELRETREAVAAKLLSRATYQTRFGIADAEAEDALIEAEREAAQARMPSFAPAPPAAQSEEEEEGDDDAQP